MNSLRSIEVPSSSTVFFPLSERLYIQKHVIVPLSLYTTEATLQSRYVSSAELRIIVAEEDNERAEAHRLVPRLSSRGSRCHPCGPQFSLCTLRTTVCDHGDLAVIGVAVIGGGHHSLSSIRVWFCCTSINRISHTRRTHTQPFSLPPVVASWRLHFIIH